MKLLLTVLSSWLLVTQVNAGIIYNSRAQFEQVADIYTIDDYSHIDYTHGNEDYALNDKFSNARMSAIMGTTRYRTTGHLYNGNATAVYMLGNPDRFYCGGCNGSFELSWDKTHAVGLDIASNYANEPYHAFVIYADGGIENIPLPLEQTAGITHKFWGVSSDVDIRSIHFGKAGGQLTTHGSFAIDNLTVAKPQAAKSGLVPEPDIFWTFLAGLGLLVGTMRLKGYV